MYIIHNSTAYLKRAEWSVILAPYAAGGQVGQYKIMQKSWKITETLVNGYSSESPQRELSNEYQHDRA